MSGIIAQNILDSSGLIKAPEGGGAWNFLSKQTASGSATIDFTSGIDSTYKEYLFTFNNIHPATDSVQFTFQADTGTNTSYNQTITSSSFRSYNYEGAGTPTLQYYTGGDLAQSTDFQFLTGNSGVGNDADQSFCGTLQLFDPSSATYAKHFMIVTNSHGPTNYTMEFFSGGYFNTTTAITRCRFKFDSGNVDSGDICLYGLSS